MLSHKSALLGGALSALGASACCTLPLALIALGLGGGWLSGLNALAPLRPLFIGLTLLFLALAFRRVYLQPACACSRTRQRLLFWAVAALQLGLLATPWLGL